MRSSGLHNGTGCFHHVADFKDGAGGDIEHHVLQVATLTALMTLRRVNVKLVWCSKLTINWLMLLGIAA